MATNMPINEPTNEFARFDGVATDIINTFQLLINQLIARRDALLRELQQKKENYISKETTRRAALEELTQQIGSLSLKVNENRDLGNTDVLTEVGTFQSKWISSLWLMLGHYHTSKLRFAEKQIWNWLLLSKRCLCTLAVSSRRTISPPRIYALISWLRSWLCDNSREWCQWLEFFEKVRSEREYSVLPLVGIVKFCSFDRNNIIHNTDSVL